MSVVSLLKGWFAAPRQPLQRLRYLLFESDAQLPEFNIALLTFLWGVWLLNPSWTIVQEFEYRSFLYSYLGRFVSLHLYGAMMFASGLGQHLGMFKEHRPTRRRFAMTTFLLWLFTFLYLAQEDVGHVLVPTTAVLAWGSALAFWRLGSSAKKLQKSDLT